jgi:Arc/MetJ-type ribon-helix-helix transcriptional regulator
MADSEHKTTIRIPKELHKAARVKVIESDAESLSRVIRELLKLWIEGEIDLPTRVEEEQTELK